MTLDTSNYKGVRDFYPEEMFIQDYITSVWHDVMQSFGYEHYSASILEAAEIYEGKTSDEIVSEQTYTFTDRGERRVTLRPEMTPSVTRMVAKKQRELAFPLRWYSIPNVFRYERPQKGRLREHWQLNADIFGIDSIEAEAELIQISHQIMIKFGLTESDFVVRINDREILENVIKELGLNKENKKDFLKLLDKKDKVEDFNEKMEKLIGRPFDLVIEPNSKITKLTEKLNKRGITNIVYDPMLVRGFDYYTGIVFEVFDTNPENRRSVFGGGRYDTLMELFGGQKVPTIGFGMGDVMIKEILQSRGLLPKNVSGSHLYIANINSESFDYSVNLANEIRKNGIDVVVDFSEKKIGDQIKTADRKNIPLVLFVGPDEVKNESFKIKNIVSKDEVELDRDEIIEFVKKSITG